MPQTKCHDRRYLQSRLREEMARARRYNRPFALLCFDAIPGTHALTLRQRVVAALQIVEGHLRPSDVVAQPFEDMIVVLLVETASPGAHDAMFRLCGMLHGTGHWEVATYSYPRDAGAIESLPLLTAA